MKAEQKGNDLANMAESDEYLTQNLKNTKIIVNVEEALEDLLVVSFTYGTTSFQGVLLNSSKKNWPCGIVPPSSFPGSVNEAKSQIALAEQATLDSDKLFAVSRRYTYFQETDNKNSYTLLPKRTNCKRYGDKTARTMRLRPRQVLCSKCKSICNENSENVEIPNTVKDTGRALDKKMEVNVQLATHLKSSAHVAENLGKISISNNNNSSNGNNNHHHHHHHHHHHSTNNSNHNLHYSSSNNNNNGNNSRNTNNDNNITSNSSTSTPNIGSENAQDGNSCDRMVLRKRRMADEPLLCDEVSIKRPKEDSENISTNVSEEKQPSTKVTPFIKISFGPQGTVLKIPPRSHDYSASDDVELQEVVQSTGISMATKDASAKAAKKALKKAKKEAQKKSIFISNTPPHGGLTTHKTRHHKHKFKHKRRHKDTSEIADNNNCDIIGNLNGIVSAPTSLSLQPPHTLAIPTSPGLLDDVQDKPQDLNNENISVENWDCGSIDGTNRSDAYNEIKKECLRQKLSISLKRLSEKSYMKCSSAFNEDSNTSGSSNHSDSNSNSEAGDVPEFPESEPPKDFEKVRPLMMRISSHNVGSCTLGDGRCMSVGDIVWGKIHGFPWWPGKVLSITVSQRDNGMLITQQAHVAWFGSSTSSYMPCSQLVPFLECFKIRYNKKKRGPYKEAIKQATLAAQQVMHAVHTVEIDT